MAVKTLVMNSIPFKRLSTALRTHTRTPAEVESKILRPQLIRLLLAQNLHSFFRTLRVTIVSSEELSH